MSDTVRKLYKDAASETYRPETESIDTGKLKIGCWYAMTDLEQRRLLRQATDVHSPKHVDQPHDSSQ